MKGRIVKDLRGGTGFGWDPLFEVGDKTYAEMSKEEKNKQSQRAKAFRKFKKFLKAKRWIAV